MSLVFFGKMICKSTSEGAWDMQKKYTFNCTTWEFACEFG